MFEIYCKDKYLLKHAPPEISKKNLPSWWKDLPYNLKIEDNESISSTQTMKSCPVIKDFLNAGIVIKLWTNLRIFRSSKDTCSVEFLNQKNKYSDWHSDLQVSNELFQHSFNIPLKLYNPYYIKTENNIWTYITPYEYGDKKGVEVLPGVVKTDKWHSFNLVVKLNVDIGETKTINFGTPIARLLPFVANTEYKIEYLQNNKEFSEVIKEQEFQVENIEHAYIKHTK